MRPKYPPTYILNKVLKLINSKLIYCLAVVPNSNSLVA
jgi:hypothetical protein